MRNGILRAVALSLVLLIGSTASADAVTPGDFTHAWNIVTTRPEVTYDMPLPEEVIDATQQQLRDVAILDANNQQIRFWITQHNKPNPNSAAGLLTCVLQSDDPSPHSIYQCSTKAPLSNALGVRASIGTFPRHGSVPRIELRDDAGLLLASVAEDASVDWEHGSVPLVFSRPQTVSHVTIEIFAFDMRLFNAQAVAALDTDHQLRWRTTQLERSEPDTQRYLYATHFPGNYDVLRLTFADAPMPALRLSIKPCSLPASCSNDQDAYADIVSMGNEKQSRVISNGTFSKNLPWLMLASNQPLSAPPVLEIGYIPAVLHFSATGVAPYTLAVGQPGGDKRVVYNQASSSDYGGSPAVRASLAPYSSAPRWIARATTWSGPALLALMLLLGIAWARTPRRC